MINEEGPISDYLEKKGLKSKQIFQKWKDSPIRQDLKDIQTNAIDQAKGGLEHAKDFASKAAETARQVASGEATKRVVTVTGPGPTDYKVDIPSNKKTNNEGSEYFNPSEKLRMPKDMTGGAYTAPGPVMKYHPVTLPKELSKTQTSVQPESGKKKVNEAEIKPMKSTSGDVQPNEYLRTDRQGSTGSGSAATGQSGSTGPDFSQTTPKQKPTPTTPNYESGGKKKMSEENNPLIDMFLKLQEKNTLTPNIFEAAKKAKKDYDKDGKIESPKDEVWGSRFRAAKMAGKMEEEEQIDEISGSLAGKYITKAREQKKEIQGKVNKGSASRDEFRKGLRRTRGIETASSKLTGGLAKVHTKEEQMKEAKKAWEEEVDYSAPDRAAVTKDNKPSTPAQTNASTSGPSDADKKALDSKIKTIAKEEVSFSEAELAFFASVFEAVAPNRPEPTKGVNPTVRNTDLTDETIAEGRPKKNVTPETIERDARQHIQVQAGLAAGGTVVDFKHDNGKISKLTPGMGRSINAHLNSLKPAERQEAVKRMHASPEGLKV